MIKLNDRNNENKKNETSVELERFYLVFGLELSIRLMILEVYSYKKTLYKICTTVSEVSSFRSKGSKEKF